MTKINFEKTSPEAAKLKMEEKINKKMFKAGVIGSIIFGLVSLAYVALVKKAIKNQ